MDEKSKEKSNDKSQEPVKSYYQGIFVTETILGNPNGSFMENEPRNIKGRVFTTDKCIKYNVRKYINEHYERLEKQDEKVKNVENFVFFYPRTTKDSEKGEASYLGKDTVFRNYFIVPFEDASKFDKLKGKSKSNRSKEEKQRLRKIYSNAFKKLFEKSPDVSLFGGTFSFEEHNRSIYGPVQISYGLDIIGAEIINTTLGTPFSTEDGSQTTQGQDYLVDHAVIGYDITINPNNEKDLLKNEDLKKFKEAIVKGTNLRKSTSKKTNSKLLLLVKFQENTYPNLGDLKTLIEVESDKISEEEKNKGSLILNFENVKEELKKFKDNIENIELYKASDVEIKEFNKLESEDGDTKEVQIKELTSL